MSLLEESKLPIFWGGLKTVLMLWDLSTNFNDSDNLGMYGKIVDAMGS